MNTYYGLDRDYNVRECDNYFAFLFAIEYIDKARKIYEPKITEKDSFFVSASNEETRNTVAKDRYTVDPDKYRFLPLLRNNIPGSKDVQRDICVIFGASGSGKSYICDKIARLYKGIQKNTIYYISSKNMLIDPSFDQSLYEQFIPFNIFIDDMFETEEDIDEFRTGNIMDNSLIIFDDLVFRDKAQKVKFWKIMNIILTLKRMNNITLIYIVHEMTDFLYTRTLFSEMSMYISFVGDLRNRNNRVLDQYLKLSKKEQEILANSKSKWTCVMTRKKTILTEFEVIALK